MQISRTRIATAAVAAVFAVVGVTAGYVLHAPQPAHAVTPVSAAAPTPAITTLTFDAQPETGNETFVDLGPKSKNGPDIGDLIAFTQTLSTNGTHVGLVHVSAIVVDHKRQLSQASGTIELKAGDLTVAGIVTQTPTFTLAVTGGTGAYSRASGTLDFSMSGDQQQLTLHLVH